MMIIRLIQIVVFFSLAALLSVQNSFSGEGSVWDFVSTCKGPDCKDPGDCKGPDCKGGGPIPVVKSINWEELKDRCARPTQFDVQRPPQNIRIQCSETRYNWVSGSSIEVNMPAVRKITTGVLSDKFMVNAEQKDFQFLSKPGTCQRFRKVEEILNVERPVSCNEILGLKGDLSDLCVSMLDVLKNSNPKLVEIRETGEVLDTCGSVGIGGNDKPEPK